MRLGVVLEPHGGVFGHQPRQGTCQPVLIGLGCRGDGDGQQRVREHPRLDQRGRVLAAQRVGGLGLGQLGHDAQVPGNGHRLGAQQVSERGGQQADTLVIVVAGVSLDPSTPGEACKVPRDVQHRVWSQCPAEHAHDTYPADIRIACRTNDFGNQWSIRVALEGRQGVTVRGRGRWQRVQRRRRKSGGQQMEQLDCADAGLGGNRDHRVEPSA